MFLKVSKIVGVDMRDARKGIPAQGSPQKGAPRRFVGKGRILDRVARLEDTEYQ